MRAAIIGGDLSPQSIGKALTVDSGLGKLDLKDHAEMHEKGNSCCQIGVGQGALQ